MILNKKITAFFIGLGIVGSMGLACVVNAESKTLKEWGVPSVEGRDTAGPSKWYDNSEKFPQERN
jgi:hypothetical protein